MALLVYGAAIYTVENKPFRSAQNVCAGNRFHNPRNVSDRFSEIWGSREKTGNVTNQKLRNVPQISNSELLQPTTNVEKEHLSYQYDKWKGVPN